MTEGEAIRCAKCFAEAAGYKLDEGCIAWLSDPPERHLPHRLGWWYVHFYLLDTLCGGYPPRQSFWVNDTTGEVQWFNAPKPRSWLQAIRRYWFGELTQLLPNS